MVLVPVGGDTSVSPFRWLILAVLLSALAVSGYHRAHARRHSETIGRGREGPLLQTLRAVMALALFGGVLLYVVRPEWMRWASVDVPIGVRWLGALLGFLTVLLVHWVLRTLGPNVSETVLTKERHALVTGGPYRWVRHPLYTTGLALFVALGIMAGSWFVLLASGIAFLLLRWLVIPREEQALLAKFGDRYRDYMQRTGRLVPRRRRPRSLTASALTGTLCFGTALFAACGPYGAQVPRPLAAWTDPSPHQVRFVSVTPEVRLEVLDWGGVGPPLVFLSGLQDVGHGFDDFALQFVDHHHVIAITRRGYGASSQPRSGYDLATRTADLRAVLDSLHLVRVALVGHSIAGDELTAFAAAYPPRVSGLVYLDAAYDHTGVRDLLGVRAPWPPMLAPDSASPAAVQAYIQRAFGMHIPQTQVRAIGRYDAAGRLVANVTPARIDSLMLAGCGHPNYRSVRAPALAIYAVVDSAPEIFPSWATLDSVGRVAAGRFTATLQAWAATERKRLRRELPAAQVRELHGANHYVFSSNPSEVTQAMRAFLAVIQ